MFLRMSFRPATRLACVLLLAISAFAAGAPRTLTDAPDRWAKLEGARIRYQDLGRGGPTLVLVHGWAGDVNIWREQAPHLAARHRVLVLDLPGFGKGDKPE